MLKEFGEIFRRSSKEAHFVFSEVLKEGDKVVVVGPSKSVFTDPITLEVSQMVGPSGRVYLADPIYTGHETLKVKGGTPRPEGNIAHLLGQLENFKSIGLNLSPFEWLGPESGIFNIPLPDGSIDAIFDHHTSVYLARWECYLKKEEFNRDDFFARAFQEDSRVLKKTGKMFFQTDLIGMSALLEYENQDMQETLVSLLNRAGIEGIFQKVTDQHKIRMTKKQYLSFQEFMKYKYGEADLFARIKFEERGSYLHFCRLYYDSPDLFLGTKS